MLWLAACTGGATPPATSTAALPASTATPVLTLTTGAVEIYNPATATWRDGPALNVARAGFAAAVVQGQVMVAGGEVIIAGHETLASLEILAPGSLAWQPGPPCR